MKLISYGNMFRTACLPLAILAFVPFEADAGLVISTEAPGVQTTTTAGVVTATFTGLTPGITTAPLVTSVGTFGAGLDILAANQNGGAGGTGNYAGVGAESGSTSETLTLNGQQSFLGVWLSAGTLGNYIQLYNGSTLVGSYSSANYPASLSNAAYYGNPNAAFAGSDPTQAFVYLDFTGTAGTTFNRVVFGDTLGGNFQADNFSVLASGGTVPEPSSMILTGSALSFGAASLVRSRRRARSAA